MYTNRYRICIFLLNNDNTDVYLYLLMLIATSMLPTLLTHSPYPYISSPPFHPISPPYSYPPDLLQVIHEPWWAQAIVAEIYSFKISYDRKACKLGEWVLSNVEVVGGNDILLLLMALMLLITFFVLPLFSFISHRTFLLPFLTHQLTFPLHSPSSSPSPSYRPPPNHPLRICFCLPLYEMGICGGS